MNKIDKDFYVDDFISSAKSSSEMNYLIFHATKLLETTGFTLTKFFSNSKAILANFQSEDLAPPLRKIILSKQELPSRKILRICWNAETDTLVINKQNLNCVSGVLTRHKALSVLNSHFDLLGLWSLCFVCLKLCNSKIVAHTARIGQRSK